LQYTITTAGIHAISPCPQLILHNTLLELHTLFCCNY